MGWLANLFNIKSAAALAGQKAGISWKNIAESTQVTITELTGQELFDHAKDEARMWLRTYHTIQYWQNGFKRPEVEYYTEFIEFVEAFCLESSLETQGQVKFDQNQDQFRYPND